MADQKIHALLGENAGRFAIALDTEIAVVATTLGGEFTRSRGGEKPGSRFAAEKRDARLDRSACQGVEKQLTGSIRHVPLLGIVPVLLMNELARVVPRALWPRWLWETMAFSGAV
jgi:hypothetical protein